jgi:hypothetical protein
VEATGWHQVRWSSSGSHGIRGGSRRCEGGCEYGREEECCNSCRWFKTDSTTATDTERWAIRGRREGHRAIGAED